MKLKIPVIAAVSFAVASLFISNVVGQDDNNPTYPPADRLGGSVPLFNGKDFTGFTFCMKNDADPMQTWSVTNGVIHCTGIPIGYIRTTTP